VTISDVGERRREYRGVLLGDGASSEPEMATVSRTKTASPSVADLAMRSDTLQSPRVSPLLWLQRCLLPSLVVTSDGQRKHGKKAR